MASRGLKRAVRPAPRSGEQARRALVERVLACNDVGGCAQQALDWLAREGVRQAMCLIPDSAKRLAAVAAVGLPAARSRGLEIDRVAAEIARLDGAKRPITLRRKGSWGALFGSLGLTGEVAHATPLWVDGPEGGWAGLIVTSAVRPRNRADVRWGAETLARKLGLLLA